MKYSNRVYYTKRVLNSSKEKLVHIRFSSTINFGRHNCFVSYTYVFSLIKGSSFHGVVTANLSSKIAKKLNCTQPNMKNGKLTVEERQQKVVITYFVHTHVALKKTENRNRLFLPEQNYP